MRLAWWKTAFVVVAAWTISTPFASLRARADEAEDKRAAENPIKAYDISFGKGLDGRGSADCDGKKKSKEENTNGS